MKTNGFVDLLVWEKAHVITLDVYELTSSFPEAEKFGLVSQIRRSAASIPANIAEGYKKSRKDFSRYLNVAEGSLEETKYHLILSRDLKYCDKETYNRVFGKCNEVGRMLHGLIQKLK